MKNGLINDDYKMNQTKQELISICKEKKIKGYSGKKKIELIKLIEEHSKPSKTENEQDTGKFRTNTKDQFYTDETVAKQCVKRILTCIPETVGYQWVEPSAGDGVFLKCVPYDKIGLDIDPKSHGIIKTDFFTWKIPCSNKKRIVYGNPPFGKQSSLAKRFIKKSCQFADVIAFILPKSFVKPSMYNAFDTLFHLIDSFPLKDHSFRINGSVYDVPCVFQIWQKKDVKRIVDTKITPIGFEYKSADYDIAFRRVGGLAGKCYPNDGTVYNTNSHYFIKFKNKIDLTKIIKKINKHIFPSNTTGPRSLSKSEVNLVINELI